MAKKGTSGKQNKMGTFLRWFGGIILVIVLTIALWEFALPAVKDVFWSQQPDTRVDAYTTDYGYSLVIQNHGDAADELEVFLGLKDGKITDYEWPPHAQIRLLEGGPVGTYIKFIVEELRADNYVYVRIATTGGEISELTAKSDITGDDIAKVYVDAITVTFGPEVRVSP